MSIRYLRLLLHTIRATATMDTLSTNPMGNDPIIKLYYKPAIYHEYYVPEYNILNSIVSYLYYSFFFPGICFCFAFPGYTSIQ